MRQKEGKTAGGKGYLRCQRWGQLEDERLRTEEGWGRGPQTTAMTVRKQGLAA